MTSHFGFGYSLNLIRSLSGPIMNESSVKTKQKTLKSHPTNLYISLADRREAEFGRLCFYSMLC